MAGRGTIGLIGAVAAMLLATPLAATELPKRQQAMTPADFDRTAMVRHDADRGQTIVSTEAGFVRHRHSPIRHLTSDKHLRAVIDRVSGAVRYEVHQSILYWGPRRSFVAAHLPAPAPRQAALIRAEHGERHCPNEDNWGRCASTKKIAFAMDESELRTIAAGYRPGARQGWAYQIEESGGRHWQDRIDPAEAAGLLLAVERLRDQG